MICPKCGQQIDSFPCPNCGFPETLKINKTELKRRSNMITMKRKTISILLAIMLVVTLAPPAFAFAEDTPATADQQTTEALAEDGQSAATGDGEVGVEVREEVPSSDIRDYTFTLSQYKFFGNGIPQKPDVICDELPAEAYNVEYEIDEYDDYEMYEEEPWAVYIRGNESAGYSGNITLYYQIVTTKISLSKKSATLYRKGTLKLKATVHAPNGKTTWTSSNTKVATVSSTGKVTAKAKGTATIKVKNGNASKTVKITVKNPKLNASSTKLYIKGTKTLKITGKVGKATFKSSNKKIATVTSGGKIKAKKNGKCTITVKSNGVTMKCKVTVKKPYLNKKSITLVKGKTAQLKITGKVGKATFKSSNKKVATVTSGGKIKAKKKGQCTITVKTNGLTLKCKVKVKNPPPVRVYITRTGKRYHCDPDCWGLRNAWKIWKVPISKAKKKGLTKCHVCYY